MHLRLRKPRRAEILSVLAAPILFGLALLFEQLIAPHLPTSPSVAVYLLNLAGAIALPFLAFAIPCAVIVWHAVLTLSHRAPGRLSMTLACTLVIACLLFVAGDTLRRRYGLDPPYALFFLGAALQIVGPLTAISALIRSQASRPVIESGRYSPTPPATTPPR